MLVLKKKVVSCTKVLRQVVLDVGHLGHDSRCRTFFFEKEEIDQAKTSEAPCRLYPSSHPHQTSHAPRWSRHGKMGSSSKNGKKDTAITTQ